MWQTLRSKPSILSCKYYFWYSERLRSFFLFSAQRGARLRPLLRPGLFLHPLLYNGLCLHQDLLRRKSPCSAWYPKAAKAVSPGCRHQFFKYAGGIEEQRKRRRNKGGSGCGKWQRITKGPWKENCYHRGTSKTNAYSHSNVWIGIGYIDEWWRWYNSGCFRSAEGYVKGKKMYFYVFDILQEDLS